MKKIGITSSFFLLSFAAASLFFWTYSAQAKSPGSAAISEVLINGPGGKEFIEFYNQTGDAIDMSNWVLAYYSKTRDWDNPYRKKFFPVGSLLGPSEFFVISVKKGDYAEESNWNLEYSSYQLGNTDGAIAIFPDENFSKESAIDVLGWGETKVNLFDGISAPSGKSLEKMDPSGDNEKDNWRESCENGGTPGGEPAEESCTEESPPDDSPDDSGGSENSGSSGTNENISASGNLHFSEIFPNPKDGSDNEYIEIENRGKDPADLYRWKIKDASKGKGYQFKEHILLDPDKYFAIYRPDSKITLNNSTESVYLYEPSGKIASSVSYEKTKKDSSYNFDGKNWSWSKYLTPGKKNKLDSSPSVKLKKPKNVYKGIPAEFSAKAKDKETKKLKYAWDFGDGKKSYLAKTSHKYLDTGKYTVTLSVSDDSQTVEKNFTVKVKKSSYPKLEIVKTLPNPAGSDSDGETIDLRNASGKKADLTGWKIATGSGEKMYNHPISEEISLNPGETKTITREISKFSLNNKAGKIRLVAPDGKTVDEVEYAKEPPDSLRDSKRTGKIAEGEAYAKIDGEWQWIFSSEEKSAQGGSASGGKNTNDVNETNNDGKILGAVDKNILPYAPSRIGYTTEDAFIFYQSFGFLDLNKKEANLCSTNNFALSVADLLASLI